MISSAFKTFIEETLNKFPEVTWDRFSEGVNDYNHGFVWVFGWIAREDSYKDFAIIEFSKGTVSSVETSSAKYSKEFCERVDFVHVDCQRVEHTFKNVKSIQL